MNTKEIGFEFEEKICEYLTQKGFKILKRNYRSPVGEIDIICEKDNVLHITEVKKMPNNWDICDIVYKVSYPKQQRIKRTCSYYLAHTEKYKYDSIKFDVGCVSGSQILYWEGAF